MRSFRRFKMGVYQQQGCEDNSAEALSDDLLPSGSPETTDIYEETAILPRIGEQYQVVIPSLVAKLECFQLRLISSATTSADDASSGIGLAIPVTWVSFASDDIHMKCEKAEIPGDVDIENIVWPLHLQGSDFECKAESNEILDQGKNIPKSAKYENLGKGHNEISLPSLRMGRPSGHHPFPGSPSMFWSDAEVQSFLLGLYIFGKNLVQVKKFLESKKMGDILSFYYGKFYRSDAHRIWSEGRKIRSKRCIHGQRLFTGWRQQELLSRVSPSLSEEVQAKLLEVARAFNEGRVTLEEFVSSLKAVVGMQVLIDAVGIGKGKHDLTAVVLDPSRANLALPLRPEIPVGKACSSLTSGSIIKFLTGDFRLSKARSNDLFWEAVWPRLLARGWHSEQPKNHSSFGSKNPLVFLIPGIKKFSRKKLVKGNHYFDSVSDILSKVASDPMLLELDVEGAKGTSIVQEESGWEADSKLNEDSSSTNQRHCYLRPRISNCNSERMKFTVVDTSLAQGECTFKLMEQRSLPMDASSSYNPYANFEGYGSESSSESESTTDTSDDEDCHIQSSEEKKSEHSTTLLAFPNVISINGHVSDDKKFRQSRRVVKSSQTHRSTLASKRRRLASCSRGTGPRDNFDSRSHQLDKLQKERKSCSFETADRLVLDAMIDPYHISNVSATDQANDKLESRKLFDLNDLPPDSDIAEPTCSELKVECNSQRSAADQSSDQQASNGNRRQSTRNRPPTARALEALAFGLLGTKRQSKLMSSTSRPSRRARKASDDPLSMAVAESRLTDTSATETISQHQEESIAKETQELLGVP
ncbi:hypothetical protein AXF42_Ash013958 [Apostasia shenzhenica]|uniref:SANT domain-containing protein n=1 Tax=Apostasia shenzhenica TaxID=1088818 RepID=A0A2I0ASD8_9ASPA|nr:hypothetical protein AXF42_Ash013958 [Apostasia shenzhenica]